MEVSRKELSQTISESGVREKEGGRSGRLIEIFKAMKLISKAKARVSLHCQFLF